jgi:hypothetical protein
MRTLRVLSSIAAVRPVTVLAMDTSYSIVRSGRRDFGRVAGKPEVIGLLPVSVTRPQSAKAAPRSINECVRRCCPRRGWRGRGKHLTKLNTCREECQTRTNTALDNTCSARTVQPSSRAFDRPGVEEGNIYRESSHIQLTSHVFPPSDEKDCSIRDDLDEMLSQT